MSVFDVRFSMAGLLIPFNSSCESVRHRGIVMNEIWRTLRCIQLNLMLSFNMHLYTCILNLFYLDYKLFFPKSRRFPNWIYWVGIMFLIRCNFNLLGSVFFPVCVTEWVHTSGSINVSVYYVKQTHPEQAIILSLTVIVKIHHKHLPTGLMPGNWLWLYWCAQKHVIAMVMIWRHIRPITI